MKCLMLLISWLTFTTSFAQKSGQIQQGRPIQNQLSPLDSHVYTISLDSGKFVYAEVFQKNIDIRTIVYGPDGLQRFRSIGEERGIDPLQFVTDQKGTYRFIIQAVEKKHGDYTFDLTRIEPVARTPEARVDQIMHPFNNSSNPGAAIAVLQQGELVFAKGYGMASLEYGEKITTTTPFQIASLSKQFTAFAIAMLAEQGKIRLTDNIHKYIPELPDYGQAIKVLDLIHHTAGLRDQWDLWELSGRRLSDIILQEELVPLIKRQRELNFDPGTMMSYSNSGYTLLAEVIQRVTGTTFREWMHHNIFHPLKMSDTFIADNYKENITGQATSYIYTEMGVGKSPLNCNNVGPTGVVSSAEDLARWMRNFRTGEVGGQEVIQQIQQRGILKKGNTTYYAFGLGVSKNKGFVRLGHHGSMAGYTSTMAYYPQLDAGVVVLSNNKNVLAGYVGTQVLDIYFPELKWEQAPRETPPAPEIILSPEYLETFVGKYIIQNGPAKKYLNFNIAREGDRLFIQLNTQPLVPLRPVNDLLFSMESPDSSFQISFSKSKQGARIKGTILAGGGSTFVKFEKEKDWEETLKRFAGTYHSPELQVIFAIHADKDGLIVSNNRTEDVRLEQVNDENTFKGVTGGQYWLFDQVSFLEDTKGNITAFRISSNRTKNILFKKK